MSVCMYANTLFPLLSSWMDGPMSGVNPDQVENDVETFRRTLFKLEKSFSDTPNPLKMASKVQYVDKGMSYELKPYENEELVFFFCPSHRPSLAWRTSRSTCPWLGPSSTLASGSGTGWRWARSLHRISLPQRSARDAGTIWCLLAPTWIFFLLLLNATRAGLQSSSLHWDESRIIPGAVWGNQWSCQQGTLAGEGHREDGVRMGLGKCTRPATLFLSVFLPSLPFFLALIPLSSIISLFFPCFPTFFPLSLPPFLSPSHFLLNLGLSFFTPFFQSLPFADAVHAHSLPRNWHQDSLFHWRHPESTRRPHRQDADNDGFTIHQTFRQGNQVRPTIYPVRDTWKWHPHVAYNLLDLSLCTQKLTSVICNMDWALCNNGLWKTCFLYIRVLLAITSANIIQLTKLSVCASVKNHLCFLHKTAHFVKLFLRNVWNRPRLQNYKLVCKI